MIVVAMDGLYDAGAFSDFFGFHSILEIRVNNLQKAPSDLRNLVEDADCHAALYTR